MKWSLVGCLALVLSGATLAQDMTALTPKSLEAALAAKPSGPEAERLAERIRTSFGGADALSIGGAPKFDDLLVAFALEAPLTANTPAPRVVSDAVFFTMA
ncbi:MAG TPA: hypothetical protein VNZ26_27905, partial [Vicinamibacterales bacterium]|nr:hypothetical protein [Vicinamibacterales bacterium]